MNKQELRSLRAHLAVYTQMVLQMVLLLHEAPMLEETLPVVETEAQLHLQSGAPETSPSVQGVIDHDYVAQHSRDTPFSRD
jgi:hypothetical protein